MSFEFNRIPIIKLWDLLLVPLQGEISDDAAQKLGNDVLERINRTDTTGLLIDVTGLWLMDSHLCSMLSRLAASAALMGTRTIISGISPEIALTLQTMGLELRTARTVLALEDALELLGVHAPATLLLETPGISATDEAGTGDLLSLSPA